MSKRTRSEINAANKRINALNRKHAAYQRRLADRLKLTGHGPFEMTPEIERALETPMNELPVDQLLRSALRRAATTAPHLRGGGHLAHVRLAKMRQKKRAAVRADRVKGGKRSGAARTDKERDRRIHEARARGEKLEAIAKAEGLKSHTSVLHILKKKPRS